MKRRSFASFLWSLMWKEKKLEKAKNEDNEYTPVISQPFR